MKTKKELLKSPVRAWDDTEKEYKSILLVPTGTKHSSGFMHIAIIGVYVEEGEEKYEICAYPDDIHCHFPLRQLAEFTYTTVRMDCYYPQGVLRYHGNGKFKVGSAISSVDIYFIEGKK